MPKVILTCQVQDADKWEKAFRTHGDLFRTYNPQSPIQYAISGSDVTICMEPADLDSFMHSIGSPATAEGMATDGVKRETVRLIVLEKAVNI